MTLNQIVRRIKTIALAHGQVKNFYYGSVTDFLDDKKTRYAGCFLQDNGGNIDISARTLTFNFRIFLLDLVHVSDETALNELDVQSDMVSIVADLLAEFDNSVYQDWMPSTSNTITLVREELDDMVAGAVADVSILTPYIKDTCAVPANN
jgi:hypothetical protein